MSSKLSDRYWYRLVAARECWRICKLWRETVCVEAGGSPYAHVNEVRAHLLVIQTERRFLRAVQLEEARLAQRASFDAFMQHRMPLP